MKTEIKEVFGTIEHMTKLVTDLTVYIQTCNTNEHRGKIIGFVKIPQAPNVTGESKVIFSKSGSNYWGIPSLPFETTKGGYLVWESFCERVNETLNEFIETK